MDLSAPLGNLTSSQKDQLMVEVRQQIAVANAQELVTVTIPDLQKSKFCNSNFIRNNDNSFFMHSRKSQKNAFGNVW